MNMLCVYEFVCLSDSQMAWKVPAQQYCHSETMIRPTCDDTFQHCLLVYHFVHTWMFLLLFYSFCLIIFILFAHIFSVWKNSFGLSNWISVLIYRKMLKSFSCVSVSQVLSGNILICIQFLSVSLALIRFLFSYLLLNLAITFGSA